MITLSLADTETVIDAAFQRYLDQNEKSFDIVVGANTVTVNVVRRADSFDCGTPGFNMANADVAGLKAWVPGTIRTPHGDVGGLAPCKTVGNVGQVNVVLRLAVMFNFHVNLVGPC